jgi:hypothetical protein
MVPLHGDYKSIKAVPLLDKLPMIDTYKKEWLEQVKKQ